MDSDASDSLPARLVLEQLPLCVALLDGAGQVVWCNSAARTVWGDTAPGAAFESLDSSSTPVPLAGTELRVVWESEPRARLAALRRAAAESSTLAHDVKNAGTAVHLALRAVARALGEDETQVLEDLERRLRGIEQRIRAALEGTEGA